MIAESTYLARILDDLADLRLAIRERAARHQDQGEHEDYVGARGDDRELEEVEAVLEAMVARPAPEPEPAGTCPCWSGVAYCPACVAEMAQQEVAAR